MTDRASKGSGPFTFLLIAAGAILLLAGTISLLPGAGAANELVLQGTPADFGENAPPVRPTVTPPPFASQITPQPVLLPDASSPETSATTRVPWPTPTPIDPADNIPARLVIPAIKLDAPVEVAGWHVIDGVSQWDVPDHFAAGWLMTSAPLGQVGNTALTGHHNIDGEVFRDLVKLKAGDRITLYAQGRPFYYQIETRKILPERGQSDAVRRENAKWMQPTEDERVTLITCWPYTSNTHRLIIVAKPAPPERSNAPIEP